MNFCRLPPDRLAASGSRLALRTSKVSVARSTVDRVAAVLTKPCWTMPLAAWPVSSAFSDSFMRGAVPWPSRSSGTKAAPSLRRWVIERCPAAMPSITTVPGSCGQPLAGKGREKLVLAVAGDAGDAQDFTTLELERDVLEPDAVRIVGLEAEIVDDEARHRGLARRPRL